MSCANGNCGVCFECTQTCESEGSSCPSRSSSSGSRKCNTTTKIYKYKTGHTYSSNYTSVITPVIDLTPGYSGVTGAVQFLLRRSKGCIFMQWEPFSGQIGAGGIDSLLVQQRFQSRPLYDIVHPIVISYRGVLRTTRAVMSADGMLRIYLNADGSSTDINMGDAFQVFGTTFTWMANDA